MIDDRERPGQMRAMRQLREAVADIRHVTLKLGVIVHAHLAPHLGVGLLTDSDLLRLAEKRQLAFAGDGIGGAGREQDN
jgi:hypothetical protein